MIIEVVAGEIGEDRDLEGQRGHPALGQAMGRDFHGHGGGATLGQFGQGRLQLEGIRCGMAAFGQGAIKAATQGADDAATLAEQVAGLGDQLADTGLAIGTGYADQRQAPAGLVVKTPGDGGKLGGQTLDGDQGNVQGRQRGSVLRFVGDGRGASFGGAGDMLTTVAVQPRNSEEQRARADFATVQRQTADIDGGGGFRQEVGQQTAHRSRSPTSSGLAAAWACCTGSGCRLSGWMFIRRRAPDITRLNTGAETTPP